MARLAIIGASGKLGFATLKALLEHKLLAASDIICTTSSDAGEEKLGSLNKDLIIRRADWDAVDTLEKAFSGAEALFLISSSRIQKDFNDAPPGKGREEDHFKAIEAAKKVGVRHIYYTSLAFANPSLSNVMTAHERTEVYLKESGLGYTIIREGLYNESWPLYLGHYKIGEHQTDIVVAGDSKISWTAINDLGLANALVLAAPTSQWNGEAFYLSQAASLSLKEVGEIVAKHTKDDVQVKLVSRSEHEQYHTKERDMPESFIKWWSKTYDALAQSECEIHDSTLEDLLSSKGVKPKKMEDTIAEMLSKT